MDKVEGLEIWNLTHGSSVLTGPQKVFNIVGMIKHPNHVEGLFYAINGGPERPCFFKSSTNDCKRLQNIGDFNIDTINTDELGSDNRLDLRILQKSSKEKRYQIRFSRKKFLERLPRFKLNLDGVAQPQQIGQVVDGRWRVGRDQSGESCLQVLTEDAGYDRIILFGRHDWTTGYEIRGRFCVNSWTGNFDHGLGIAFKWNPHLQGDGTSLPSQWSTGFGMYYIQKKNTARAGLRISVGVDVCHDEFGRYKGEDILGEGVLSFSRWLFRKIYDPIFPNVGPLPQIVPRVPYRFRMLVSQEKYAFTLWKAEKREPYPQIVVVNPRERLPRGSVGIIAHHCALSLYEFNVSPI